MVEAMDIDAPVASSSAPTKLTAVTAQKAYELPWVKFLLHLDYSTHAVPCTLTDQHIVPAAVDAIL